MKRKFKRFALLVCPFLAAAAASGQTAWYPYVEADGTPTYVDLVVWDEWSASVVVQILNATPWDIQFNSSPALYTLPNGKKVFNPAPTMNTTDRHEEKSFMFAPVGVPNTIPGSAAKYFPDICKAVAGCVAACTGPGEPRAECTEKEQHPGHPYSMVFSWDDHQTDINFSTVWFKIKGLQYCIGSVGCDPQVADVPLGIYMSRISPPKPPITGYIRFAISVLKTIVDMVKWEPGDLLGAFELAKELGDTTSEAALLANQTKAGSGHKMYVSAFPPPDTSKTCYAAPEDNTCYPAADAADDATAAINSAGGAAQGSVVVMTHVMRSKSPTSTEPGSLPVVMITVMRYIDWLASDTHSAATTLTAQPPTEDGVQLRPEVKTIVEQLRKLLNKHGLSGLDALRVAIAELTPVQRQTLPAVWRKLKAGEDITSADRQFLHSLVVNLRLALNEKEEG